MKDLWIKCPCGEKFRYSLDSDDPRFKLGLKMHEPILISHKDHFITITFNDNLDPIKVERVISIEPNLTPSFIRSTPAPNVEETVKRVIRLVNPRFHFLQFLSKILREIPNEEDYFLAGRLTGKYLWKKRREPILKMGATFSPNPELIVKTEIIPIFNKTAKINVLQEDKFSFVLQNTLSPQFMLGVAQGIIEAIHSFSQNQVLMKYEYLISGSSVFFRII
ncbi:MAG: hypothetical protein ACTSWC_11590 [Promethearchaeota archaeon]